MPYDEILIDDYTVANIEELPEHRIAYNLFDLSVGITHRAVALSELDKTIDTKGDFLNFINNNRWIDELVIIDDRPRFENTILETYSRNTLRSYLYRINSAGIPCFVSRKRRE